MAQQALPGFRDFYPEQMAERSYIVRTWRDVVRRYAFVEYDGPPLEPLDLYTRKSGEEIVGQLYNFVDKGGREVAMRPEMTPTFARMVGAKANALRKPVRWFAIPQLFRYERQQKGRLREHYQLNVDLVGETSVTADAELLACAIDIMRAFGLTSEDVVARVSDRRVLQAYLRALDVAEDAFPTVFAVVDKIDRQPRDVSADKLGTVLTAEQTAAVLDVGVTTLDQVRDRVQNADDLRLIDEMAAYLRYVAAWFRTVTHGYDSICRSCADWRTTLESSSSCSTEPVSFAPSVVAAGMTRCSARSAARIFPRWALVWAMWC